METTSYRYHTGLIFGMETLTVFTRVRSIIVTIFGTCSHRYGIVSFQGISCQNEQKKIWYVNKFETLPNKE